MANYRRVARRKARKYGINPRFFSRQIQQESGFNPHVSSPAGAQGIAQIMPATARSWGVNPGNPRASLDAAARHMAQYLHAYHGSWAKALTAYNAGPGAVGHGLPAETRNYIHTILGGRGDVRNRPGKGGGGGGGGPSFHNVHIPQTQFGVKLGLKNVVDTQAFQRAQRGYLVGQLLAKHHGTGGALFKSGLLSTTAPVQSDFTSQILTSRRTHQDKSFNVRAPGGGGGSVDGAPNSVNRMLSIAKAWDRAKVSYLWGGGHGSRPARPGQRVDCSGYVSAILGVTPRVSGAFSHWGRAGRGRFVTVYSNSGHVLIQIGHRWFATSHSNPGGGAGEISRPSHAYLSRFTRRHPRGL